MHAMFFLLNWPIVMCIGISLASDEQGCSGNIWDKCLTQKVNSYIRHANRKCDYNNEGDVSINSVNTSALLNKTTEMMSFSYWSERHGLQEIQYSGSVLLVRYTRSVGFTIVISR